MPQGRPYRLKYSIGLLNVSLQDISSLPVALTLAL